jgi:hypothetical protein
LAVSEWFWDSEFPAYLELNHDTKRLVLKYGSGVEPTALTFTYATKRE